MKEPPIKILAFLQNQWFKDPEKAAEIFERHPDRRNDLIRLYLFAGCLTGRRLSAAFGDPLCRMITWEETSPRIGGESGSKFKPDFAHIRAAIEKHRPDVVVCFGRIAGDALRDISCQTEHHPLPASLSIYFAPHPAARDNPMDELSRLGAKLRNLARG